VRIVRHEQRGVRKGVEEPTLQRTPRGLRVVGERDPLRLADEHGKSLHPDAAAALVV
jgi:hypothetical protein